MATGDRGYILPMSEQNTQNQRGESTEQRDPAREAFAEQEERAKREAKEAEKAAKRDDS